MTTAYNPASQLSGLIQQYGSIDAVPLYMLKSLGFADITQAKLAAQKVGINPSTGFNANPTVQTNGTVGKLIQNLGKNITGTFVNQTMPQISALNNKFAGTGGVQLPDASQFINQPNQVQAAGSGLQDVAPMPGGVQYGQPGGSTLGAGSSGSPYPPMGTGSTYDEQVPQGSGLGQNENWDTAGQAPDWNTYMKGYGDNVSYAPIPVAPAPATITAKDFTPQAQSMAATAYSPAFAAIEEAKKNANTNYANADAIVGGIYKDLGTTLTANYADLDNKYAAQKTATQADTTAAQGQLADTYGAAGTQMADEMKRQGLGQYAASIMAPQNDQLAFQSGQIAKQGTNATQAQDSYKLAADTYGTGTENAAATQGAFSRQQLAFDLANTLSQDDQNKLNLSSDEALKVLDLAQSLTGQDIGLQTTNAGLQNQYYQNQLGAAQAQNSQIASSQAADYQRRQDAFNAAYGQYKDQTNWAIDAQKTQDQQSQFDASLAEDWAKAGLTAQTAASKAGALNYSDLSPSEKYQSTVTRLLTTTGADGSPAVPTPEQTTPYTDVVQGVLNTYRSQGTTGAKTFQQFVQDVVNSATQNNLNPTVAEAIANAAGDSGILSGIVGATALGPLKP